MAALSTIEGIGEVYQNTLKEAGITSVEKLLEAGSTKAGRAKLAETTNLSDKLLLKWINHADLMRIKGIGGEYSELLEAAGVDTVPELAGRRADNLYAKMCEINDAKKLVRKLPTQEQVAGWVEQAKALPRIIHY
ncbi:MAG: DUF4332 domain-containing protein [Clostridiaceae bacterium]|jgi:predicted flap endonuclease-1-like 5' DNA nuclease|nr:DUF4332 domain-containing protein [Clostridiaceae bacterium]